MAFSATKQYRFAVGNKYEECWQVTVDAVSGAFATGLSVVDAIAAMCPVSAATASPRFKANVASAGTATNGQVSISGCASGDVFNVICIGH